MSLKFKIGDLVKMTESFKERMCSPCKDAGKHVGPFDPEDPNDCYACSTAHIKEFGDCIGKVIGYPNSYDVEVRWMPSNLKYMYCKEEIELI